MRISLNHLQQYVVETKLTINSHAVTVEEIEYLETVDRHSYEPYFIDKPQPAEYIGKGTLLPLTIYSTTVLRVVYTLGKSVWNPSSVYKMVQE